jgi:hypothetical protein
MRLVTCLMGTAGAPHSPRDPFAGERDAIWRPDGNETRTRGSHEVIPPV